MDGRGWAAGPGAGCWGSCLPGKSSAPRVRASESHLQRNGLAPALQSEPFQVSFPGWFPGPHQQGPLCMESQPTSAFCSGSRVCSPPPQFQQEGQATGVPPVFPAPSPGEGLTDLALHPASRVTCPPGRRDPQLPADPSDPRESTWVPSPALPSAAPGARRASGCPRGRLQPPASPACLFFISPPPHLLPPPPPSGAHVPF